MVKKNELTSTFQVDVSSFYLVKGSVIHELLLIYCKHSFRNHATTGDKRYSSVTLVTLTSSSNNNKKVSIFAELTEEVVSLVTRRNVRMWSSCD